ncbi:hypothetical protein M9H77_29649 [Catharanthus roseus]|uniref:Uncharacterized protein n=1 Tax=Catharanthus roseus TaxID=4058 RepID=A0ACB9ZWB6_CATRO|nr:hypothetical protein M9H77_29649 [Catharanthus roseus]
MTLIVLTEFNSLSCVIPSIDEYYNNVANYASRVLERGKEKELGNYLEDLPISLFLNPSLSFHEVSFKELKSLLFLSSHVNPEDVLMSSGAKFDPSCYGFGILDNASFVDPNIVGFELECDVLQDKSIGKFIEQCNYVLPFLGVFMKNNNDFILFNQHKDQAFSINTYLCLLLLENGVLPKLV